MDDLSLGWAHDVLCPHISSPPPQSRPSYAVFAAATIHFHSTKDTRIMKQSPHNPSATWGYFSFLECQPDYQVDTTESPQCQGKTVTRLFFKPLINSQSLERCDSSTKLRFQNVVAQLTPPWYFIPIFHKFCYFQLYQQTLRHLIRVMRYWLYFWEQQSQHS